MAQRSLPVVSPPALSPEQALLQTLGSPSVRAEPSTRWSQTRSNRLEPVGGPHPSKQCTWRSECQSCQPERIQKQLRDAHTHLVLQKLLRRHVQLIYQSLTFIAVVGWYRTKRASHVNHPTAYTTSPVITIVPQKWDSLCSGYNSEACSILTTAIAPHSHLKSELTTTCLATEVYVYPH